MRVATVVGSGIGGLAAAIRLALKGYSVIVFEKAAYAGGKIAQIEDEGYRFDMGPSLFTLPSLVYELFALAGRNPKGYFEVIDLPVTCNYFFPDGKNIKAWSDHNKFVNEVVESGIARDVIENYLEKQSFLYNHTSDFFLFNSIHKVSTYFGEAGQKSLKALHRLDAFTSMHSATKKHLGSTTLPNYSTAMPPTTAATLTAPRQPST
jgi:phytoene dehydrogenase-like protein